MVQAQIGRDQARSAIRHEGFLRTLGLRMRITEIHAVQDTHFTRALELINKTNQFNTTRRRLTHEACMELLAAGSVLYVFQLQERFSKYGLTAVAIVDRWHIAQFVMSCHLLGLGAEAALIAHIAAQAGASGSRLLNGDYIATNLNALARDLFARNGFIERDGAWQARIADMPPAPAYIQIVHEPADA